MFTVNRQTPTFTWTTTAITLSVKNRASLKHSIIVLKSYAVQKIWNWKLKIFKKYSMRTISQSHLLLIPIT